MIESGEDSMSIFEFSYVGIPMIIIGVIYMIIIGVRLLPNRPSPGNQFNNNKRDAITKYTCPDRIVFFNPDPSVGAIGLVGLKNDRINCDHKISLVKI